MRLAARGAAADGVLTARQIVRSPSGAVPRGARTAHGIQLSSYHVHSGHSSASGGNDRCSGLWTPTGFVDTTDRCREKTISRKGKTIDLWYSGKPMISAGTSRPCFTRPGYRCGFLMCFPAMSTTWPPPARTSWACCGRSWRPCPCWPIPGTKALVTASTSGEEARRGQGSGHQHPGPQRPAPLGALPGRARFRAADPALAHPAACHCQPRKNRPPSSPSRRRRRPRCPACGRRSQVLHQDTPWSASSFSPGTPSYLYLEPVAMMTARAGYVPLAVRITSGWP